MAGHLTKDFSYYNAAIRSSTHVYFALADDDDVKEKQPGAIFASWTKGSFEGVLDVDWNCAGMAVVKEPQPRLVAVGEYGEVLVAGGGTEAYEQISSPSRRGPLRGAGLIGDSVYAAGMGRQVYKRVKPNNWANISPSSPT